MFGYAAYEVWADFRRRLLTRGTRAAVRAGRAEGDSTGSVTASGNDGGKDPGPAAEAGHRPSRRPR